MTSMAELANRRPGPKDRSILDASNILIWDIETYPARVEFDTYDLKLRNPYIHWKNIKRPGGLLSWSAKWLHEPHKVYYSDIHDDFMLDWLLDMLDKASFDVTYNGGDAKGTGGGFDHRKVRGYLAVKQLIRPRPSKSIDLIRTVRTLGFESNSLGYACRMFNTQHQKLIEIGAGGWQGVMDGNEKIRKLHRRYGTHDVRCLEDLYLSALPLIPNAPHVGFAAEDDAVRCPRCGSDNHRDVGAVQAVILRFRQRRCDNCTGLFRTTFHSRVGTSRAV